MITSDQLQSDAFSSEEDLDFKNLTPEEQSAYWEEWFQQVQATNEADRYLFSHGVFQTIGEKWQDRYNRGLDPITGEPLNGREPSV